MKHFTLTLILNSTMDKVLMCEHNKFKQLNYIGGKIDPQETAMGATYRELSEETGIVDNDLSILTIFRHEIVTMVDDALRHEAYPDYNMFISIGVLKSDNIVLKKEKNPLVWIDITDMDSLLRKSHGDGNCYTYLKQGFKVLQEHGYEVPGI